MLHLSEALNFFINQTNILIVGGLITAILSMSTSYNALYKSWENIKSSFEPQRSKPKINIEYNCLRLIEKDILIFQIDLMIFSLKQISLNRVFLCNEKQENKGFYVKSYQYHPVLKCDPENCATSALDIAIKKIPLNRTAKTARLFEVKDIRKVNFDNYQDQSFIDYMDSLPEPKQYEWKNIRGLTIEKNHLCYLTFMGRIQFCREMIDLYPIPQDAWFLCIEDQNGKMIKKPLSCIDC